MKLACSLILVAAVVSALACSVGSKNSNQVQKVADSSPTAKPSPEPRAYSKDLSELRAAFNRDKNSVRLITLLSPT